MNHKRIGIVNALFSPRPRAPPPSRASAPRRRPRTAAAGPGGRRERRVHTLWTAAALWHTRRRCRGLLVQRAGAFSITIILTLWSHTVTRAPR
jgi:hypothetical protein